MPIYLRTYVHTNSTIYIHIHMHTYSYICIYTYIYVYTVYIHMYVRTCVSVGGKGWWLYSSWSETRPRSKNDRMVQKIVYVECRAGGPDNCFPKAITCQELG